MFGFPTDGGTSWNIGVFGPPGSGKSSFINTLFTIFSSGENIVHKVPTGAGEQHITKNLMRYEVVNNISIFDMWGLSPSNGTFRVELLDQVVQGKLPIEYAMEEHHLRVAVPPEFAATDQLRRLHSIIFFFPWGSLDDSEDLDVLKTCFRKFRNFNPIIAITRVDEKEANIKNSLGKKFPSLEALRQKMSSIVGAPLYDIFCVLSYTDQTARSFELERITFQVLHRAMMNRQDYAVAPSTSTPKQRWKPY